MNSPGEKGFLPGSQLDLGSLEGEPKVGLPLLDGFGQRMEAVLQFFPLYELRQKHTLTEYYGFELGLCLLLYIMEQMLRNSPCTYEGSEAFITGMLSVLLKRPVDGAEGAPVARKLVEEITNYGRPFQYRYFNPSSGREELFKFRLVEQRPHTGWSGQDTVVMRLTEEGLDLLFKSREIYHDLHFSVMQLYLDQQIRRGVFDEALKTVRELAVAVDNIEEQCRRQRDHVRRNVVDSVKTPDYGRLLGRMEEQLHREQEIFASLKGLVRETGRRLEAGASTPDNRVRQEKVTRLGRELNLVAARHLELISTRFGLENLVSQMLQESIYQSMMVRFHIRREFLGAVITNNPPGQELLRTTLRPLLRPRPPRLLGPETFLSPQRLLSRDRDRPLEIESEELDDAAWAAQQAAEEERKERTIGLLKRFFGAILEALIRSDPVETPDLAAAALGKGAAREEAAAFAFLLLLLHQGRTMRASLPWEYVPGDEDLVEYAFYQLLLERPELAAVGPVQVEADSRVVQLPHDIELRNIIMRRMSDDAIQLQDGGDSAGAPEGVAGASGGGAVQP